ncbi:MAG: nucleoside triphosphate pyrophosphohydrolase [Clostridia bacterium]|nr:nucleoside triphosphate pyrophosphohydrolase [Clostridia bacterium]
MVDFEFKEKYGIDDLVQIIRLLRGEGGCPWDMQQTHQSIRNNVIEEAYEVADAVDTDDKAALCEELGDLLMQVVFHARMAEETGDFNLDQVADGVCQKLVHRHPHVFGTVKADTVGQVLDNWDAIKMEEKNQQTYTDTLLSVPRAFPGIMRAAKVQKRAAKVGFDWADSQGAWDKLHEEIDEVRAAEQSGNADAVAEEVGDLLFSVVNVTRFLKVDGEEAISKATDKFISRFDKMEQLAVSKGLNLKELTLEEMDALWDEIKQHS